jgi:glutamyl-tRNA synthetase
VRLGWSHGNDEIFSTEQAIQWFDIADVGKSAARFDFAKLADLNGHYIRQSTPAELVSALKALVPHLADADTRGTRLAEVGWERVEAAIPSLQARAKTLLELLDGMGYLTANRPLALEPKAAALLDDAARTTLAAVATALESQADWSSASLETAIRVLADAKGLKLGQVAQPLRAALTGRTVSPPVFDVMAVLGRDESLVRIREQIGH